MSGRLRVAFFTPRVPWPIDRGDRLRAYHLIRCLAPVADITLVTSTHDRPETLSLAPLHELCGRVEVFHQPKWRAQLNMLLAAPGRMPFQVAYFKSAPMDRLIASMTRQPFDFVFGHLLRAFPYVEPFTATPVYIDLCDSQALNLKRAAPVKNGIARPAFFEEWRRVEAYETRIIARARETWAVNEIDRQDMLRRLPGANVRVIPNGVDLRWGDAGLAGPKGAAVMFLGNLTVGHNVDAVVSFATSVWPRVRREVPDAEFHLVGEPGPTVRALGGRDGIHVAGFVENLEEVLGHCVMSVAPLRYGAGIQNKVLETMAAGLPAQTSSIVARSLGAEPGREVVVADGEEEQVASIVALLRDTAAARRIGAAGQAFVRSRFTWQHAADRFREIAEEYAAAR